MFGTAPDAMSPGLRFAAMEGSTFVFVHPGNGAAADDIEAVYQWSSDFQTFYDDGTGDGATTVTFSPQAPSAGTVTVVAEVTGPVPTQIFVRISATQQL